MNEAKKLVYFEYDLEDISLEIEHLRVGWGCHINRHGVVDYTLPDVRTGLLGPINAFLDRIDYFFNKHVYRLKHKEITVYQDRVSFILHEARKLYGHDPVREILYKLEKKYGTPKKEEEL